MDNVLYGALLQNIRILESGQSGVKIEKPADFGWNPDINLYRSRGNQGEIYTDFDILEYEYTGDGKAYYVDIVNGSDSNNGTRLQVAYKTIKKALEQSDVDIVYVAGGTYNIANGFNSQTQQRSVSIKGVEGHNVIINATEDLTFALSGGQTYTYEATTTNTAYLVNDSSSLTEEGDYKRYTLQTSIANVEANPGSFYVDGTTVYVHSFDSRNIIGDEDIKVYQDVKNLYCEIDGSLYLENLNFEGGSHTVWVEADTYLGDLVVAMKDCTMKYGKDNGIYTKGCVSYAQNCKANANTGDGFGYHGGNGNSPRSIEINCEAHRNATLDASLDTVNGSTSHSTGSVIRVNGKYSYNEGPNVADVQKVESWNLGCVAYGSISDFSQQTAGFNMSDASNFVKAWLDNCKTYGNYYGLVILNSGSDINLKNCTFIEPTHNPESVVINEY